MEKMSLVSVLVFLGAGLGGVARYWMAKLVYFFIPPTFPYGTLVVNVSGSFVMGILAGIILSRITEATPYLQALFLFGFLGGYTTFSAFSLETLSLYQNGLWLSALINIFASVFLCLGAVWFGAYLSR